MKFELNNRQQHGRARCNFFTKAKNKFCKLYGDTPVNRRCFNKHFKARFQNGKWQVILVDYFGLI